MVRTTTKTTEPVKEQPADAEVTAVVPVVQATPPATTLTPVAATAPAPRNLAVALALAQQRCRPVEHNRENTFHKYAYTSAEAVISEAKQALADTGLTLVPIEQSLNSAEGGGYELCRRFLLLHSSGESLVMSCAWPVICEKGRPVDKATAISSTSSLAYMLRDLLLMPRVAPGDDLAAREDREPPQERPQQRRQEPAPKKERKGLPADGKELKERLTAKEAKLVAAGLCKPGELLKYVAGQGKKASFGDDIAAWAGPAIELAVQEVRAFEARMKAHPGAEAAKTEPVPQKKPADDPSQTISAEEVADLRDLMVTKGCTEDRMYRVASLPNVALEKLTLGDYQRAQAIVSQMPDAKTRAAGSAA